jgi:hypothetical protein
MKLSHALLLGLSTLVGVGAVACKKNDQPAQSQYQPGTQCGGMGQPACAPQCGGVGQPPCAQPQPTATTTATADPNANPMQALITGFMSAAQASLGAVTGGEIGPVQGGIQLKAKEDAKGMKPVGQLLSGKLQQGGHAQGDVTLQPNKCYTVVGFGGFGVTRYQINLILPVVNTVLAQSPDGGPAPTLGPNEQCYRNSSPVPVPAKVDMFLVAGQGIVGAQVYEK